VSTEHEIYAHLYAILYLSFLRKLNALEKEKKKSEAMMDKQVLNERFDTSINQACNKYLIYSYKRMNDNNILNE